MFVKEKLEGRNVSNFNKYKMFVYEEMKGRNVSNFNQH